MNIVEHVRGAGIPGVDAPAYLPYEPWFPPAPSMASRSFTPNKGSLRGRLVCHGPAPRVITYESQLERKTALVLLARPDVERVEDQPEPVKYVDALGDTRKHTFDFRAHLLNGTRIAFAVKPWERAKRKNLDGLLRRIAAQVSPEFANTVVLVTERELPRDLVHDAELIHEVRGDHAPEDDRICTDLASSLVGVGSIGSLVDASGLGARGFRAFVRLIGGGSLRIVGPRRIGYPTDVEFVGGVA